MLLLTPKWNEATNEPQYVQLYTYIKNEIIAGRLAEKVRLPSVRKLADLLGLSTTPVEMAYQQLLAEGFIQSRPRSGYFVEKLPDPEFSPKEKSQHEQPGWNRPTVRDARNYQYDFHMSQNDFALFPYTLWRRLYNQLLCQAREEDLFYGDPQGEPGLRRQIADYLYRYRGVTCSPDQIVVGADQFGLLSLICLMLKPQLERIGAENPGYLLYANTFRQHGYETVPLPLLEDGIDVSGLYESQVRLAVVSTPCCATLCWSSQRRGCINARWKRSCKTAIWKSTSAKCAACTGKSTMPCSPPFKSILARGPLRSEQMPDFMYCSASTASGRKKS